MKKEVRVFCSNARRSDRLFVGNNRERNEIIVWKNTNRSGFRGNRSDRLRETGTAFGSLFTKTGKWAVLRLFYAVLL